jgi:hypothetical protein
MFRENYVENSSSIAPPLLPEVGSLQDTQSACPKCAHLAAVQKNRTSYDKYWLKFYNQKAAATDYDLLKLQFAK